MKLPDLNIWLSMVWDGHVFHNKAAEWFGAEEEPIRFCRITQMGFLRLVTNPTIMRADCLNRQSAWEVYERLLKDPRIGFDREPEGLNKVWMSFSKRRDLSHKLWTDDYFCAFAYAADQTLVTFDRAVAQRHPAVKVLLLQS